MGKTSKIEWLHRPGFEGGSWNPIRARIVNGQGVTEKLGWHCEKVPGRRGCAHCYAEAHNMRLGTGLEYANKNRPLVIPYLVNLDLPARTRKPTVWFVDSMTDLFGEWVPDDWIHQIIQVMITNPQHLFITLTKRHNRMLNLITRDYGKALEGPGMRHMTWGVSAEDKDSAWAAMEVVCQLPVAHNVISYEPAVGGVDWLSIDGVLRHKLGENFHPLEWILVGGESMQRGRVVPFEITWAQNTLAWCRAHGTKFFMKQFGSHPVKYGQDYPISDAKGHLMEEWPEDLRVREFPEI
jgi:protein gp37